MSKSETESVQIDDDESTLGGTRSFQLFPEHGTQSPMVTPPRKKRIELSTPTNRDIALDVAYELHDRGKRCPIGIAAKTNRYITLARGQTGERPTAPVTHFKECRLTDSVGRNERQVALWVSWRKHVAK
jgi:hypothetical protein